MLKLSIKYFLNSNGLKYFPTWYSQVLQEANTQDGFVSMICKYIGDTPIVYLTFENEEKLDLWREKESHDELVLKLQSYWTQTPEVTERID